MVNGRDGRCANKASSGVFSSRAMLLSRDPSSGVLPNGLDHPHPCRH